MKRMMVVVIISLIFSSGLGYGAIIDFEEINIPTGYNLTTFASFTSRGFIFSAVTGELRVVANSHPWIPNTGDQILLADGAQLSSFDLAEATGAAFDLNSLLALEGRINHDTYWRYSAHQVGLVGNFATGGTISRTLDLDLIATGDDLNDSEFFSFTGWTGLSSIRFTGLGGIGPGYSEGYSFGLDDINLSVSSPSVPIPGAVWLLGTGLIGLIGIRKKAIK